MMEMAVRIMPRKIRLTLLVVSFLLLEVRVCHSGSSSEADQHAQSFSLLRRRTGGQRGRNPHYYWEPDYLEKNVDIKDAEVTATASDSGSSNSNNNNEENLNPYWDPVYWNALANPYWSTEYWHAKFRDNLLRQAQDEFVAQCLTTLEATSQNNKVNRDQFVQFIRQISRGSLVAREFKDLPLFLTMIFLSAACTSGEDCVGEDPAITTASTPEEESQLNQVLCRQLMRFPFLEVLFPFQFLIRVSEGVAAEDLLAGNDPNQIIPSLEKALDHVVLEGLNCSNIPEITYTPRRRDRSQSGPRAQRQPQPQEDCDFVVDVSIEDAADYRKFCI